MSHVNSGDPHDAPHRVVDIHPLAEPWALVFEISECELHVRLRLVFSEVSDELVACLTNDVPFGDTEWGFSAADVMDVASHVVWHVTTGVLPGACDEGDGDE